MAKMAMDKEVPYCTMFLVFATIFFHGLVLLGNYSTANALYSIGQSTHGWSEVGIQVADALDGELNHIMDETSGVLTNVIKVVQNVQEEVDSVLGMAGSIADDLLTKYNEAKEEVVHTVTAVEHTVDAADKVVKSTVKEVEHTVDAASKAVKNTVKEVEDTVAVAGALSLSSTNSSNTKQLLSFQADDELMYMMQTPPSRSPRQAARREVRKSRYHNTEQWVEAQNCMLQQRGDDPVNMTDITQIVDDIWEKVSGGDAAGMTQADFLDKVKDALLSVVNGLVKKLSDLLDQFFDMIKPALEQIGKWLVNFGDQVAGAMTDFTVTLDTVQKIFDQVMAQIHSLATNSTTAGDDSELQSETFTLFDNGGKGYITEEDIKVTADTYTIDSLYGDKAPDLFKKYDTNKDGKLSKEEYGELVHDPSIPGVMAIMLRDVSKNLVTISGKLAKATYRDEVAREVVDYLAVQVAKNMTKVSWVCDTLTNRSLPPQFSADVLKNVAMDEDKPEKSTTTDVGQTTVDEYCRLNPNYTAELLVLLMDPEFWDSEGFDPADEAKVVKSVAQWVINTPEAKMVITLVHPKLVEQSAALAKKDNRAALSYVPEILFNYTSKKSKEWEEAHKGNETDHFKANLSQVLRDKLLGGTSASSANKDDTQKRAINSGQLAVPETLEFAARLSSNASATASTYQSMCFENTGTSSSAKNSFATTLKEMIQKVQGFTKNMQEYSTDEGIERLEDNIKEFAVKTGGDIVTILMTAIESMLPKDDKKEAKLIEEEAKLIEEDALALVEKEATQDLVGDIFVQVHTIITSMQLMLPAVVDDLKFAKKAVADIASPMKTIFVTFQGSGPPIFYTVAELYKTLWTVYFVALSCMTLSILFYAFWAAGWCSDNKDSQMEAYEPPRSFCDRMRLCCSCCGSCCRACHDSTLAFWSVILILEIFVLVLFIVSIVICILSGVKLFLGAGCSAIYLLGDVSVCTGAMNTLRSFLDSFFQADGMELDQICDKKQLLACKMLQTDFLQSVVFTIVGSMLAAVFSFQLIVESAIQHERARWRKAFEEEAMDN